MQDDELYVPTTVSVYKDGICLFEADCEALVRYIDDAGELDLEVLSFHFDAVGTLPKQRIFTAIHRHEPLFHVMYKDLDHEWLDERIRETLAANGIVDLYGDLDYGRD